MNTTNHTNMNDKHDLLPTCALHGYVWQASSFRNGGVATHSSGWKIAVDLDTGEWSHYKSRSDKMTEGKWRESLAAHLSKLALASHDRSTLNMMRSMVARRPR
jgi:hypothetical protein